MTLAIFVVGMIGLREAYGVLSPARLVYGHVDKTEPTTIRAATIPASTMPMLGRCQFLYLRAVSGMGNPPCSPAASAPKGLHHLQRMAR